MYFTLLSKVDDVVEELKQVMLKTEKMYVEAEDYDEDDEDE